MQTEKQRERLVELIAEFENNLSVRCPKDDEPTCDGCEYYLDHELECDKTSLLADYLMSNNVVVLPCKVGDTVYSITECSCENIDGVHTECLFYGYGEDDRVCLLSNGEKCPYQYRVEKCYVGEMNIIMFVRQWGKTVFLSREEAENVLKERKENEK